MYVRIKIADTKTVTRKANELPRTLLFQGKRNGISLHDSYVERLRLLRDSSNSTGVKHPFLSGSRRPFALRV